MRGRLLLVAALAAVASAQLGASWPTGPVARPGERADRAPVERAASVRLDASSSRRRLVAEEDSERDIALIMLWSAIGLIFIGYFTFSALFRMEVENDALLYSKVRATPPSRAVPARPREKSIGAMSEARQKARWFLHRRPSLRKHKHMFSFEPAIAFVLNRLVFGFLRSSFGDILWSSILKPSRTSYPAQNP